MIWEHGGNLWFAEHKKNKTDTKKGLKLSRKTIPLEIIILFLSMPSSLFTTFLVFLHSNYLASCDLLGKLPLLLFNLIEFIWLSLTEDSLQSRPDYDTHYLSTAFECKKQVLFV